MALLKDKQANLATVPIEKVAQLIRSFSRQQQAVLVQLVPELRSVGSKPVSSIAQSELVDYFQRKMARLTNSRPMNENDMFIEGLTVAEFFALPEVEQQQVWSKAETTNHRTHTNMERDVLPDAIPA